MLIADTAYQERERWRKTIERTRALTAQALAHQAWQVRKTRESETENGIADPRNTAQQIGRPLMPHQLMAKLLRMNGNLVFQKNNLGNWAILYPAKERQADGGEKEVLRYAAWFEDSTLTEWDIENPQYHRAWDAEKRDFVDTLQTTKLKPGWRGVLSKLLRLNLITLGGIRAEFNPSVTRKSWKEIIRPYGG
jgi:hypothetical protein